MELAHLILMTLLAGSPRPSGIMRTKMKSHLAKWSVILALLPLCWLAMMAVHEAGHVLGACASGGEVAGVHLHPFSISRTELARNPHPLFVAWAGPMVGVVVPLVAYVLCYAVCYLCRRDAAVAGIHLWRFFAGFCLIANGAYLSFGSFNRVGDAGEILKLGTPTWVLWAFGLIAMPAGLWLWHRLGPQFGLGPDGRDVAITEAIAVGVLLALVLAVMLFAA
jgi:hypothetical protein